MSDRKWPPSPCMIVDVDLESCPMCGGKALCANYIVEASVYCGDCGLKVIRRHGRSDEGVDEVIAAWNRRALSHAAGQEAVPIGWLNPMSIISLRSEKHGKSNKEWLWRNPEAGDVPVYLAPAVAVDTAPPTTSAEVEQLRDAAVRVNNLYPLHWDRVDGAAVVMPERVAEFEEAFGQLNAALAASSEQQGAVARSEGDSQ